MHEGVFIYFSTLYNKYSLTIKKKLISNYGFKKMYLFCIYKTVFFIETLNLPTS